jgi:hypothetical protein
MIDTLHRLPMIQMFDCMKQEPVVCYTHLPVEKNNFNNFKKIQFRFILKVIHIHRIVFLFQRIIN